MLNHSDQTLENSALTVQPAAQSFDRSHLTTYRPCVRTVVANQYGQFALFCQSHLAWGKPRDAKQLAELDLCIGSQVAVNQAVALLCGFHVPQPTQAEQTLLAQSQVKG